MLRDLLLQNRSIRSFKSEGSITEAQLTDMIECTRYCPSSANLQALKFRPVFLKEECDRVFSATKWAGYLPDMEIPPRGHEPSAYIVVLCDKEIAKNPVPFYKDTGIVSHTILLRACEMGFGGCMIGSYSAEDVKEALSISDRYEITLILALGEADENPVILDAGDSIKYYRENGVHYVPKRTCQELILK